MNNTQTDLKKPITKKFMQVSLSAGFAEMVKNHAESADRSLAAQLEHWSKIGRAVDAIAPAHSVSEIKSAQDSNAIWRAFALFVIVSNREGLLSKLALSEVVRFGTDPSQPGITLKYMPDGSVVKGKFDEEGNFDPLPPLCPPTAINSDPLPPPLCPPTVRTKRSPPNDAATKPPSKPDSNESTQKRSRKTNSKYIKADVPA
jgi:hypothetical protein